jgi:hypothetical protein
MRNVTRRVLTGLAFAASLTNGGARGRSLQAKAIRPRPPRPVAAEVNPVTAMFCASIRLARRSKRHLRPLSFRADPRIGDGA